MSNWLSFGGGMVDTGLGLLRDHWNKKWQEDINAQNWQQEQQAATTAYERQLALMDRYHTPMAQRDMLEQAGLNVGLMYAKGGGGMSGGGANVAKAQGASAQATQMQANLGIARQAAEIDNIKADTKEKETQANLNIKGEEEKETYIQKLNDEILYIREQLKTEIEKREGQKLENAWQTIQNDMAEFDKSKQAERFEWEKKYRNNEITLQTYVMNELQAAIDERKALTKKYEAETRKIDKETEWIDDLNTKHLEKMDTEILLNKTQVLINAIEWEIANETKEERKEMLKTTLKTMQEQYEIMQFTNDNKEFMYHFDNVLRATNTVVDIGNMVSNFLPTRHVLDIFKKETSTSTTTTTGPKGTTTSTTNTNSTSNTSQKSGKKKVIVNK